MVSGMHYKWEVKMLGTDFTKNKKAQSGSVMLEVIAVLALMGVMGSMLFRQIYQRNQELHNIQMASEIRTVKEAFSAYVQTYRSELLSRCSGSFLSGNYSSCAVQPGDIGLIQQNLPAGWLDDDGALGTYYDFYLVTYQHSDISQRKILIGVVVPTESTLPQTGWNFKRAARVALLIGADGGVYDSNITQDGPDGFVSGAMGTWQINADLLGDLPDTTYVATTGLDIFTPEFELPAAEVNLPENWSLALNELHAWNYFSAGNKGTANCYTIQHHSAAAGEDVSSDDIHELSATCQPLFFVDTDGTGKVFVNHDLEIGSGTTTNLTLTQEGVIKQAGGLTIDADGRIISKDKLGTDIGDLEDEERYLLDPAHTSVMNDIYLTSRGGVRLSDILPNYILKGSKDLTCSISSASKTCTSTEAVPDISCPERYNKAYLITPIQFATQSAPTSAKVSVSTSGTAVTGVTLTGTPVSGVNLTKGTVTSESGDSFVKSIKPNNFSISFDSSDRKIVFTYSSDLNEAQIMAARVDSYCVFEPSMYTTEASCELAGFTWSGGCTAVRNKEKLELTEAQCESAGFTWDNASGCRYVYVSCNIIDTGTNNGTTITNKPAVCKAAGCTWNGTNCTNP